jgi:hypothetical protein
MLMHRTHREQASDFPTKQVRLLTPGCGSDRADAPRAWGPAKSAPSLTAPEQDQPRRVRKGTDLSLSHAGRLDQRLELGVVEEHHPRVDFVAGDHALIDPTEDPRPTSLPGMSAKTRQSH